MQRSRSPLTAWAVTAAIGVRVPRAASRVRIVGQRRGSGRRPLASGRPSGSGRTVLPGRLRWPRPRLFRHVDLVAELFEEPGGDDLARPASPSGDRGSSATGVAPSRPARTARAGGERAVARAQRGLSPGSGRRRTRRALEELMSGPHKTAWPPIRRTPYAFRSPSRGLEGHRAEQQQDGRREAGGSRP